MRPPTVTGLRSISRRFQTGRNLNRGGQCTGSPRPSFSSGRPPSGGAGQPASRVPLVFFKRFLGSLGPEQGSGGTGPRSLGSRGAGPRGRCPQVCSLRGLGAAGRMRSATGECEPALGALRSQPPLNRLGNTGHGQLAGVSPHLTGKEEMASSENSVRLK